MLSMGVWPAVIETAVVCLRLLRRVHQLARSLPVPPGGEGGGGGGTRHSTKRPRAHAHEQSRHISASGCTAALCLSTFGPESNRHLSYLSYCVHVHSWRAPALPLTTPVVSDPACGALPGPRSTRRRTSCPSSCPCSWCSLLLLLLPPSPRQGLLR